MLINHSTHRKSRLCYNSKAKVHRHVEVVCLVFISKLCELKYVRSPNLPLNLIKWSILFLNYVKGPKLIFRIKN